MVCNNSCNPNFKNIKILEGENQSRFPSCRSIYIPGKEGTILDPGASENLLGALKTQVKHVINTHYHFDHVRGNYIFRDSALMYMNEIESPVFTKRTFVVENVGVKEVLGQKGVTDWIESTSKPDSIQTPFSPSRRHEWYLSYETVNFGGSYSYGTDINETVLNSKACCEFEAIHTPGHSNGFCCIIFPDEDAIYTGDIDLTQFGPWYGSTDGNIDLFIESARKIANFDLKHFITGHEAGILEKEDFMIELEKYLSLIDIRDEKVLHSLVDGGKTLGEIRDLCLIYGNPKYLVDSWVFAWETMFIRMHLERLQNHGKVVLDGNAWHLD